MAMRRSTGWFLGLLVVGCGVTVIITCLTRLAVSTGPAVSRGSRVLDIRIEGSFPDRDENAALNELFGRRVMTLPDFQHALEAAAADEDIAGALVRVGALEMGWARATEVRDALVRFRQSGKPVHAFLEGGDDGSYFIASAADETRLIPSATLWLDGISADVPFYGGTLEKAGVRADLEQIGEYKNAADVMKRSQMSPAHRESMDSLLDGLWGELTNALGESLGKDPEAMKEVVERGPFTAQQALDAGLVKALGYRDEADAALAEAVGKALPRVTLARYAMGVRPNGGRDAVAVVHCSGTIMEGDSAQSLLGGSVVGSDTIVKALRAARESPGVKAVVLRVDSPGGSPVASDIIWRETQRVREAGIPVVVSMSDVAASGGYWISMGADRVVACPATITGSIGIYGGKYVLEGLNDKLALHVEGMDRGPNSGMNSSRQPFTAEQRTRLQEQLDATYRMFIERAASGRGFDSPADVDKIARGRVWTGRQALERGLVDELGGMEEAIAAACRLAHLPEDEAVSVRDFPRAPTLFEMLVDEGPSAMVAHEGRVVASREIAAQIPSEARRVLSAGIGRLGDCRILAWTPVSVLAH